MKARLIGILIWALRKLGAELLVVPPGVLELVPAVRNLCLSVQTANQSGEWKRRQVISKLIKRGVKERDAALAIEYVVRHEL